MRALVLLTFLYAHQQGIDCYIFDDSNETAALNMFCEKADFMASEGNIGQSKMFPWLGVLRVHIHQNKTIKIAATGLVLVKDKFAIGNANDLAKIPQNNLRYDSKVMFISRNHEPWFCNVVDYVAHPEYEITTFNTVAILELSKEFGRIQSTPICWPLINFNTNNQLYAVGYTDENQLLEKTVHRLEYVDKSICTEFYQRSQLAPDDMSVPVNYRCAYAVQSQKDCVWDNGMVVASNASGKWILIGLVITGPGCAAPARFLDTTAYMPWIITTMDLDNNNGPSEDVVMRRSAFGVGFKRNKSTRS